MEKIVGRPVALESFPIHLGRGGGAMTQPALPSNERAMGWYAEYAERTEADGADGRLVSSHQFTGEWTSWEMHPAGAEVVICVAGSMTLLQESGGGEIIRTRLQAGDYAINPPGIWHSADVEGEAQAIFITAGQGTQHRPR